MKNLYSFNLMVNSVKDANDYVKFCTINEVMQYAVRFFNNDELEEALSLIFLCKSLHYPMVNLDFLRALIFLKLNSPQIAYEAVKEELKLFANNTDAINLFDRLDNDFKENYDSSQPHDFINLYEKIKLYTTVGVKKSYSLYENALKILHNGPQGNFVECGVGAGGTSAILAYVLKDQTERKLFACDSFVGLPKPSKYDTHHGLPAAKFGQGEGIAYYSESNVKMLCANLGADNVLKTIKGYFEQTLPKFKSEFGKIAFLHLDANWYISVKVILESLYDQIEPGGYIQISDYGFWDGVRMALDEFLRKHNLAVDLVKIDNTGLYFIKK